MNILITAGYRHHNAAGEVEVGGRSAPVVGRYTAVRCRSGGGGLRLSAPALTKSVSGGARSWSRCSTSVASSTGLGGGI